ncbi:MAG TPA: hypothetical protein P5088_09045, partial [Tenuifilum sp.]|nr:hypothetical protein [Tenuifilum sp.]HQE55192.1 hypothetical protein [Tenuifilum sp.]HQG73184.1 hypothetical protein [Tenuifilum sp.]HQI89669.1 hypothetical protein [Tenuifilum sp.]HRR12203.1 hypothetical protein [Tenuifilum sp.]
MNRKKSNLLLIAVALLGLMVTSCDKNDDDTPKGTKKTVSGEISQNTLWEAKDTIILDGYVYVKSGATLTIEPGTLIKGLSDSKACLIVERGARIV